jgi:3-hydroxyisobutyrate dehydrogenase-like beta-hydroxyacid dehydrogenase
MTDCPRVGVAGLGRMGLGLAMSHQRVSRSVRAFDIDADARERAVSEGITAVDSLEDLADEAVILMALPDGPDVSEAFEKLLPHLNEGALVIDCSTIDPATTAQLAQTAESRGVRFRDAGMAGSPADAANGNLLFMVGCPEADWEEVRGVLEPIGRDVVRCGNTGAGVTLKVVNNLLALTVFLADAEALSIAAAANLDLDVTLDVLSKTGAANAALTGLLGAQLLPRQFDGAFRTMLAHKDARIALELAERLGTVTNTLGPTRDTYEEAVASGFGDMAAGAAGLVVERRSGVTLGDDS